jgi:hypothetical protein
MLIISEKIHIKLCKYLLEVGRRSTNSAVLGELGRFPLILEAFLNVVKYWALQLKHILLLNFKFNNLKSLDHTSKFGWLLSAEDFYVYDKLYLLLTIVYPFRL